MIHKDLVRRTFLASATAAATSTALVGQSASSAPVSANDKISVAFVGVGVMGSENLKAAAAQPGVQVGSSRPGCCAAARRCSGGARPR